jgi:hypothetical protein
MAREDQNSAFFGEFLQARRRPICEAGVAGSDALVKQ